jgi:type IV secretory pathway VirB10-like protein
MSDDPRISGRYRELPREEPPRALDDAILAASRRAVDSRPAPLVVPTGRRRWYFPVAAAAIIVLAVAVTVHVERERPSEEIVSAVEPQKEVMADQARSEPARRAEPKPFAVEPPPPPPLPSEARKEKAAAAPSLPEPAAAPPSALAKRADEANAQPRQAEGARARSEVMARAAAPVSRFSGATPEQWLLAIEDLKRQGKHEEAQRELTEFRKRYPNYRIPEAITEKFETR